MKLTWIKTVHEETYSDGRTLGVLVNFEAMEMFQEKKLNSFVYYFRVTEDGGMYVFFETIVDMNDYMLYGGKKVKRAYMREEEFDKLLDNGVEGIFDNILKWV